MRKKRAPESEQNRTDRLAKSVQHRKDETSAEDDAIDAAIKRSIRQFGA